MVFTYSRPPGGRDGFEAIAGRKVRLVSVRAKQVETIEGLRPSGETIDLVATTGGTVRAERRLARLATMPGLHPDRAARLVSVGFQGATKKALVELAPLRCDADSGRYLLARKLVVKISFRGREPSEFRRVRRRDNAPYARFVTTEKGLHRVSFEAIFSPRASGELPELLTIYHLFGDPALQLE